MMGEKIDTVCLKNYNEQMAQKKGLVSENTRLQNQNELEFVIFCIENIAIQLGVSAERVYDALARKSDILYDYIVPCYEMLHTQGKEYIVNDILGLMRERGISL